MDRRDILLGIVYLATLVLIVATLFELWGLAIIFFLVLAISLVQKINFDQDMAVANRKREKIIALIDEYLNDVSKKIELLAYEIKKKNFFIENRMENREDAEKKYRELVSKIVQMENKINEVKKTLSVAYGDVDNRLKRFER